jgi:hypothetical protein
MTRQRRKLMSSSEKGSTRQEYKLSPGQLERLLEASKPVPYMVFGGHVPSSPQENADRAWQELGAEVGFDWKTVDPLPEKGQEYFTAVPHSVAPVATEPPSQILEMSEEDGSVREMGVEPPPSTAAAHPTPVPWTYGNQIPAPKNIWDVLAYAFRRPDNTLQVSCSPAIATPAGLAWADVNVVVYALTVLEGVKPVTAGPGDRDLALLDASERRVRIASGRLADSVLDLLASVDDDGAVSAESVADTAIAHAKLTRALDSMGVARALVGDAADYRDLAARVIEVQEIAETLPRTPKVRDLLSHLTGAWIIAASLRQSAEDEAQEGSRE